MKNAMAKAKGAAIPAIVVINCNALREPGCEGESIRPQDLRGL
jgi:hypothetical protein